MKFLLPLALLTVVSSFTAARADVKLPLIFGDHMVLQEGKTLPVWGTATAGEKVTVTIGANSGSATAGADGAWRVDLKPLPESATGATLTVAGKNTITLQDVVVGDVWLASGQSNMELPMHALINSKNVVDIKQVLADSTKYPLIRIFLVPKAKTFLSPNDLAGGVWKVASPQSVEESSAVAYFFGQIMNEKLKRPIGLIDTYWGGLPIEMFTSLEALKPLPFEAGVVKNTETRAAPFLALTPDQQKAAMADYNVKLKDWQTNIDTPYRPIYNKWRQDDDAAKAAGQPEPPRPVESQPRPVSPDAEGESSTVFNGMIKPIIPYAIKGALWYQGESNGGGDGMHYIELLPAMITDWRTRWNEGDFPFLVVGLANFGYRYPDPVSEGWAGVREGEIEASQKMKNVAVAEAIDIGEGHNIHPVDKIDLGKRLAAAALHIAYGQDGPWIGPTFASATVEPTDIRIKFANTGKGLVIGASPHVCDDNPALPTDKLVGFAIAGDDKKWVWADAKISGDEVIVSSPQVAKPAAVRFAWANDPQMNLYNKEGFPAEPFRTDAWAFVPPPHPPVKW